MSDFICTPELSVTAGVLPLSQVEQWYAVYTKSHFEKSVAEELARKSIETYLPAFREIHRWKDRKKVVDVPVFPGYVFVRITADNHSRVRVLQTGGTVRILGYGSNIQPIAESEIESVRKLVDSGVRLACYPMLKEGSWVRVRRGALEGLEGRLARIKNQTHIVVSIEMLSRSVSTEIDVHNVEPIRPAAISDRPASWV